MRQRCYLSALATAGVLILSIPASLHAQTTASISGVVADDSGGVLPGVAVTVNNVETGVSRTVHTGAAGRYSVPQLPLGSYEVTAQLEGFRTAVQSGIRLTVGREAVVNLVLTIGQLSEQVVVTGEAPLVDATSATVAALVDRATIERMPLNGRDITQLATLQQGVMRVTTKSTSPTAGFATQISIAGSRPNQVAFVMDGTDLTSNTGKGVGGVSGAFLGVDTVQEFNVQISNYSAEYGRAGGGIVNVVTRTGTNDFKGGAFYYHRNDRFDAPNYFDVVKADFARHQYGATLGGPLMRNKSFFFGSYEGYRQDLGTTSISFVPNAATREGRLPNGRQVAVSPAIQPLLKLWPLPNGEIFADGTGEYAAEVQETTNDDHFSVRFDHTFSEKTSAFARYAMTDGQIVIPLNQTTLPGWPQSTKTRTQYLTVQSTRIVSPSVLFVARAGVNRSRFSGITDTDVPELRFYPDRPIGRVVVSGVSAIGPGHNQPFDHPVTIFDLGGDTTYSGGAHTLKTGFLVKQYLWGFMRDYRTNGTLTYLGIEDLLLNRADRFEGIMPGSPDTRRQYRQRTIGFYVQDGVRVNSRLTVNLGLRYEFITNPIEASGRGVAIIPRDWDVTKPAEGTKVDTVFGKNPSLRNFSPRVGFAWAPTSDERTSLRGGWGLFYDQILPLYYDNIRIPPLFYTIDLRARTLGKPIPYPNPASAGGTLGELSPMGVDYYNDKTPTVQQWNLTLQREIMAQTVFQIGYVGSRSKYLPVGNDPNTRVPQFLPDGRVFFPAEAPRRNPRWGRLTITEFTASAFYQSLQASLNRRFRGGFQFGANYTFSKAIDDGSAVIAADSDTDGRARPNPHADVSSNRGLAGHHVAHVLGINYVAELPFGPGRRFASGATGFGAKLLEGWAVQGIVTAMSGPPFSVTMGGDRARSFTEFQRPNLKDGASNSPVLGDPRKWYDVNAFELPPAGYFGNLGRNTLIGPGLTTVDLSVVKKTRIASSAMELRIECFNLLNRVNFGVPGREVFTGTGTVPASAGRITGTTTTARQMQIAARFSF